MPATVDILGTPKRVLMVASNGAAAARLVIDSLGR
jgi:hypothetical protein